jgi:hypothetical protein
MKKLLFISLLSMTFISLLQSCKKGENDPAISFRSRDARLIGSWKMVKLYGTRSSDDGTINFFSTFTYDGYTFLDDMNNGPVGGTGTYEMIIEKHGNMSWSENIQVGNQNLINSGTGYWKWINTDKNKSMVNLSGGGYLFKSSDFVIDRLAYKELILRLKYNTYEEGDTYSFDYTYTFERQ